MFLLLAFQSAILSTLSFEMVLSFLSVSFMFHDSYVVKNEVVKPINSFEHEFFSVQSTSSLELSWYRLHPKPSLRNVAIVVLINDPSNISIILVEEVFISSLISNKQLFFVSGRMSSHSLAMFP